MEPSPAFDVGVYEIMVNAMAGQRGGVELPTLGLMRKEVTGQKNIIQTFIEGKRKGNSFV